MCPRYLKVSVMFPQKIAAHFFEINIARDASLTTIFMEPSKIYIKNFKKISQNALKKSKKVCEIF